MTKKIVAVLSSVLLLVGSVSPIFASTITVTGNGSGSFNEGTVTVTNTTQVQQSNTANITTNVDSSANSGGNSVSHNTGGNNSVDTGNAKTQVSVVNNANSNVANVSDCNCGTGNVDVNVSGNGDSSANSANAALQNTVTVGQTNVAHINNNVQSADANSGYNDAGHNTGGNVRVSTGDATTKVNLSTNANQNLAEVGGANNVLGANTASVAITGNGSGSQNLVNLGLTDWVVLGQNNAARVNNNVDASADTGYNNTGNNTGGNGLFSGDVTINTGNASTNVAADTAVNFNQASIGCDCLTGVTAKIAGNGASDWWNTTESSINASLVNGQAVSQANGGKGINNNLYGQSQSGDNGSFLNTGEATDPSVMTGDSTSTTMVANQGNANIFGNDVVSPFPWNWSGSSMNVSLTFSLGDLLAALGMH